MKKAIRCIAFLIITFLVIIRTYDILKWKDTSGDYLSSTKQLYSTENNLMDIIFLGSSHCYCTISPDVLWGSYGFSAFNMTTSGQDKNTTYHLLKETLKTQTPKVVCVEIWGMTSDEHGVLGNVYRNMLAMNLSRNSIDLVQSYIEKEEQADYILRWPIVHTRYKELEKYDFVTMDYSEYGRGSELSYHIGKSWVSADAIACEEVGELTDKNRDWLEALYELSQEEEFELVLFLAPTTLTVEEQMQMNAAAAFAKENGIPYFDFNKLRYEVDLDYNRDFIDGTHTNARGAEKISNYLGAYFSENYALEDHRGEEEYYQWEKSYEYYEHVAYEVKLKESATLEEYIIRLNRMRDITYIFSFEGTYDQSGMDMERVAKSLGLTKEQYETGGTYICQNGNLEFVMDNESDKVAIYEMNEYDAFKIQNMKLVDSDATNKDDIMLNRESVGTAYNGLCFVVYDNVRKTIIDKRGYY